MTDTTWAATPTEVLGRGGADLPTWPAPGAVGLPIGGVFAEAHGVGGAGVRMRPPHGAFAVRARTHEPAIGRSAGHKFTRNDRTTLGFSTPGRPQS